jgi:hypothetical protein
MGWRAFKARSAGPKPAGSLLLPGPQGLQRRSPYATSHRFKPVLLIGLETNRGLLIHSESRCACAKFA